MTQDSPSAPTGATLTDLDARWHIVVGTRHQHLRYIGGPMGRRVATDGGQLALISEDEFQTGLAQGWGALTPEDPWTDKTSQPAISTHDLAQPSEVRATDGPSLALRYGDCWVSAHYVAVAMKYGATTIEVTGENSEARCPDLCVIMPIDMEASEADPSWSS